MDQTTAEKPILNMLGEKVGLGPVGKEGVALM
jgi:hypothetical protein